jgi:hypothetical protein
LFISVLLRHRDLEKHARRPVCPSDCSLRSGGIPIEFSNTCAAARHEKAKQRRFSLEIQMAQQNRTEASPQLSHKFRYASSDESMQDIIIIIIIISV